MGPTDDDKRCAHRLRANAEKLRLLAHEFDAFRPTRHPGRREVIRQALEHTRSELLEIAAELPPDDEQKT